MCLSSARFNLSRSSRSRSLLSALTNGLIAITVNPRPTLLSNFICFHTLFLGILKFKSYYDFRYICYETSKYHQEVISVFGLKVLIEFELTKKRINRNRFFSFIWSYRIFGKFHTHPCVAQLA